jgi:hypothetical protein
MAEAKKIQKGRLWEVGLSLMNLANLTLVALLLEQTFSDELFNLLLAGLGLVLFAWLYSLALWLMKKDKERGGDS